MDKPFVYDPVLDHMINSETDPALFDVVYFNSLPVPNYSNFNVDTNMSAEFTPLLSPVVQNNLYSITQSAKFSPLSSPVLEYNNKKNGNNHHHHHHHSTSRQKRKDSSDTPNNNENSANEKENDDDDIGGGDDEDDDDDDQNSPDDNRSFKRSKTPVTTPLLQASDKSLRNSIVSGSRSNSIKDSSNAPLQSFIFKQQKSQTSQPPLQFDLLDELDGGLTLPPPPPPPSQSELPIYPTSSFNNFRIPRISTKKDSVLINPNHHKSAQSSPVILPSSSSTLDSSNLEFQMINQPMLSDTTTPKQQQQQPKGSKKLNIKRIGTNILSHQPKQPIMLSGSSTNILSSPSSSTHDKKTSHKLAEQGRRNRMNIAVQELDQLIPDSMKREITIPSKATTVELACRYIEELLKKLEENEHTK